VRREERALDRVKKLSDKTLRRVKIGRVGSVGGPVVATLTMLTGDSSSPEEEEEEEVSQLCKKSKRARKSVIAVSLFRAP
jgi:hypothetical protein